MAESTLKKGTAEGYARSLIEASLDPLVTIGPDGKITDVNEATIKATGVARAELIGTNFSKYFTDPAEAEAGYKKVLQESQVRNYPLSIKNQQTGQVIDVSYNASVYKDEQGKVIGIFASARDVTKAVLEGAEELLVEWAHALDTLGFVSREGFNTLREIEKAAASHWLEKIVGKLPPTETAYQAAVQFRDLADQRKVILKQNFLLEEKGEIIHGTFLSKDCPYRKCCGDRKKAGKQYVCFRATPFIQAIKLMSNQDYKSEVIYEQTEPGRSCLVRGLPTEMSFKVGLSYKVSKGTVKIHESDCGKIGIGIIDNITLMPSRKELQSRKLTAMSYSQTKFPPGMVVMSVADAKALGLQEKDTVFIRKAGEQEEVVLVETGEYGAAPGTSGEEYTIPGLEAPAAAPRKTAPEPPEQKAAPPRAEKKETEKEEIKTEEGELEEVEEKVEEVNPEEAPVEEENSTDDAEKEKPAEDASTEEPEEPAEEEGEPSAQAGEKETKKKKKKNNHEKEEPKREPKIDKTKAMKDFEEQIDGLRKG